MNSRRLDPRFAMLMATYTITMRSWLLVVVSVFFAVTAFADAKLEQKVRAYLYAPTAAERQQALKALPKTVWDPVTLVRSVILRKR